MTSYRDILKAARTPLTMLVATLLAAGGALVWLSHAHGVALGRYALAQGTLQGVQSELQTLTFDLDSLETQLTSFKELSRIGLIGDPDREAWIEGLKAIYESLGLPATLRYSLAAPKALAAPSPAPDPVLGTESNALKHELLVELSGIHEEELLAFLRALKTQWQAPFRVEACDINRDNDAGLLIKCTLSLFSLPLTAQGQQAGG